MTRFKEIEKSVMAGIIGLAAGALVMLIFGYDPISAYLALFKGGFGSKYGISESLANATPLILTALTFAIAFRGGMFNIGAEGQLYLGALACVGANMLGLPPGIDFVAALIFAALGGIIWCLPVALLKITRGLHEVLSTIMFNWIARYLAFFLIVTVLVDPTRAEKTISVAESSRFPLLVKGTSLSYSLFVAIGLALICYFVLWRTVTGFNLRVMGHNPEAAEYAGIKGSNLTAFAFVMGGLTAGLAGAMYVMGRPPTYAVYTGMPAIIGLGFEGIAVAMIGRNHPLGIIFAAIFFGGLLSGGRMMQMTAQVPLEVVRVLEGVIVTCLAVPEIPRILKLAREKVFTFIPRPSKSQGG